MLSYVAHDVEIISEVYENLSGEDRGLIRDAVASGDGLRVFQDGSLQDDGTHQLILDSVDGDELIDEDQFRSEAEAAGSELESDDEDSDEDSEEDSELVCGCYLQ